MHTGWISHDGSDCPAELAGHHRVDIETNIGFMNSVRADKVNWKNVTAWRLLPQETNQTTPEHSGALSTYGYYLAGVKIHQAHEQSLKDNQEADRVNPCKCIDCGGTEPSHSNDCEYMKALYKSTSVQDTLNDRASRYGDIETLMTLSQNIQQAMRGSKNWWELVPAQREALQMIASKIARILNGDPNYKDNWHDIQGYARLAEERCKE